MNLAAAFGSLVGVGASTLVAIKLGQKDKGECYPCFGKRRDAERDNRVGIYDRGVAVS